MDKTFAVCANCGKETPVDSLHCVACGISRLDDERDRDERPRRRGRDQDLNDHFVSTETQAISNSPFMK